MSRTGIMAKIAPSLIIVWSYLEPTLQRPRIRPAIRPMKARSPPMANNVSAKKNGAIAEKNAAEGAADVEVGAWAIMLEIPLRKGTTPTTVMMPPTTIRIIRVEGREKAGLSTSRSSRNPIVRTTSETMLMAAIRGTTSVIALKRGARAALTSEGVEALVRFWAMILGIAALAT